MTFRVGSDYGECLFAEAFSVISEGLGEKIKTVRKVENSRSNVAGH